VKWDEQEIVYYVDGGQITDQDCDHCGGAMYLEKQLLTLIGGGLYRVKKDGLICGDCEQEIVTAR